MTEVLRTPDAIVDALRQRMRVGEGLSVPYGRKWSIGGCEPLHSLWSYPHDALFDFSEGLSQLQLNVSADDLVIIDTGSTNFWVAANGKSRSAERASEFLIGYAGEETPVVVVNSPEVAIELIRALRFPAQPCPTDDLVQIGFPGIHSEDRTYVGSWQWNVHAEARGEEFICRTANAVLTAIYSKETGYES